MVLPIVVLPNSPLSDQYRAVSHSDLFATGFQACTTLDGRLERVGVGRRNGHLTVLLSPDWADGGPRRAQSRLWSDDPRYYVNLNGVERRTWRRILSGASISAIAAEEGVSRAAIYARIQGNNKGQGGMVAKNFWVLLWWLLRQRSLFQKHHD
jgi:hypothetical protein